jgi:hypothetical protein
MKKKNLAFLSLAALLSCGFVSSARGSTITVSATEEAMVQSGQPNLVWDPKGAIEFSANGLNTAAPGNTEYGLMEFNSASIVSQLNSTYPAGWTITGVSVSLAANFATAGVYPNNSVFNEIEPGNFTLSWLSNNGWVSSQSGGATWNNLPNYVPGASNSNNKEEAEGTFYWPADGVHGVDGSPISYALTPTSDLLNAIGSGGYVSIIGTPADSEVGCLSNTPTQGNAAQLVVTAVAVPEPGSAVLILTALGITALGRWRWASR